MAVAGGPTATLQPVPVLCSQIVWPLCKPTPQGWGPKTVKQDDWKCQKEDLIVVVFIAMQVLTPTCAGMTTEAGDAGGAELTVVLCRVRS